MKWYQDADGNTSGKRIFGAIGFSLFIIMAILIVPIYSLYIGNDIGSNTADLLKTAGWVSGSLLGIGVAEKLFKRKQEVNG